MNEKEIVELVSGRATARASKDWRLADEIRDRLASSGIRLYDQRNGTRWRIGDSMQGGFVQNPEDC